MPSLDLEDIAYWYFRLNGCLTIRNFVVHPDEGRNQETDVDLIAARFPHRAENLVRPMSDDRILSKGSRIKVLFVEAKASECALNGPWTNKKRRNMERVLTAIGPLPRDVVKTAAHELYECGRYRDSQYDVSMFCIGARASSELTERYPDVPQLLWPQALDFVFNRFTRYRNQKVSHPQWDEAGRLLWTLASRAHDVDGFLASVRRLTPGRLG